LHRDRPGPIYADTRDGSTSTGNAPKEHHTVSTDDRPDRRAQLQPESLRLREMSAGLTVSDLGASRAWYCDTLGFTLEEEWKEDGEVRGISLVAGTARLFLSQDDWKKGRDRVKGVGIGLHFATGQNVDELAAGIRERGGKLATEPADLPWGERAFSVVDPDGFRLTIGHPV
jgi:uncharacterized glyoxalase superfamily protein PhnB